MLGPKLAVPGSDHRANLLHFQK